MHEEIASRARDDGPLRKPPSFFNPRCNPWILPRGPYIERASDGKQADGLLDTLFGLKNKA